MAISKPFDEILTYTRDSGGTRVNAAGLIVGVDFSVSSVTFGTGAKTFTLAADANVNRDWPVGSRVRATSQASPLGVMNGTVTSYDPALQELVINVTESTGTGTGTNWRIGSLEFRRDFDPVTLAAKGGFVEAVGATNIIPNSNRLANFTGQGAVITQNFAISPDGSTNATKIDFIDGLQRIFLAGLPFLSPCTISLFIENINATSVTLFFQTGVGGSVTFTFSGGNLVAGGLAEGAVGAKVTPYGSGRFRIEVNATTGINFFLSGNAGQSVIVYGAQYEASSFATSYNPTTTVAVSRAADLLSVDGANFTQAYNQSQGKLLVECIPTDSATSSAIASINDGTLDNEIRVGQKQSGTRSSIRAIASDGVTDVMGLNATGNNIVRSNGVDYTEADTGQVANGFAVASAGVGQFIVGGTNGLYSITDDGGATWDNFQLDVADRAQINGAAFGNGVYVLVGNAVGGSGLIVTVDPVTGAYTRRVSGTTQVINNVRRLGGRFYAVANGSTILHSSSGDSWTSVVTAGQNKNWQDIAFNGTVYVAAGLAGGFISISSDGISFGASTQVASQSLLGIVGDTVTGLLVAVGNAGTIITSPNGTTWTLRTSGTPANLFAVHYSTRDQQWYAAGDNGTILRSSDTITWESIANDAVGAVLANGVIQSNPFLDNLIPNQVNTIAMRLKANDFAVRVNDGAIVTDNNSTMPLVDRLNFGFNGHIRKLQYFPSAEEL